MTPDASLRLLIEHRLAAVEDPYVVPVVIRGVAYRAVDMLALRADVDEGQWRRYVEICRSWRDLYTEGSGRVERLIE